MAALNSLISNHPKWEVSVRDVWLNGLQSSLNFVVSFHKDNEMVTIQRVVTVLIMKYTVTIDVNQCSLVEICRRFRSTRCFRLQNIRNILP